MLVASSYCARGRRCSRPDRFRRVRRERSRGSVSRSRFGGAGTGGGGPGLVVRARIDGLHPRRLVVERRPRQPRRRGPPAAVSTGGPAPAHLLLRAQRGQELVVDLARRLVTERRRHRPARWLPRAGAVGGERRRPALRRELHRRRCIGGRRRRHPAPASRPRRRVAAWRGGGPARACELGLLDPDDERRLRRDFPHLHRRLHRLLHLRRHRLRHLLLHRRARRHRLAASSAASRRRHRRARRDRRRRGASRRSPCRGAAGRRADVHARVLVGEAAALVAQHAEDARALAGAQLIAAAASRCAWW